jgi:hypothetical protein
VLNSLLEALALALLKFRLNGSLSGSRGNCKTDKPDFYFLKPMADELKILPQIRVTLQPCCIKARDSSPKSLSEEDNTPAAAVF